jgi:DNA polymerase III subunit gamma/tau
MAFYHTYRPQNIADLELTQQTVAQQMLSSVMKKSVSHAYLFTGGHGIGKTSSARILAKIVNCLNIDSEGLSKAKNPGGITPCNECENCVAITGGHFLDVTEMDAASNRGVDEIRSLKETAQLMPVLGKKKVYIIDEVHMLTNEAFNALLKILEEPPSYVLFILCTTELHKVPKTIQSRCTQFVFKRPGAEEIKNLLGKIAKEEKLKIDEDAFKSLVSLSGGAYRDAVKLLEQLSLHDKHISRELVEQYCVGASVVLTNRFLDALSDRSVGDSLEIVNELTENNTNFGEFLKPLIDSVRAVLFAKVRGQNDSSGLFASYTVGELTDLIEVLMKAYSQQKMSPMPSLPLELAVIKFFANASEGATAPRPVASAPAARPAVVATASTRARASVPVVEKPAKKVEDELEDVVLEMKKDVRVEIPDDVDLLTEVVMNVDLDKKPQKAKSEATQKEVTFEEIQNRWSELVRFIKTYNASVAALIRSCKPVSLEKNFLTMETTYTLHKDLIEKAKNRAMIEQVIFELLAVELRIKVTLKNTKIKPNQVENVKEVESDDLVSAVQEIFGV